MDLKFTLSVEVTNTIMNILAEQPYKTVAPILASMQMQANVQMNPLPPDMNPNAPAQPSMLTPVADGGV